MKTKTLKLSMMGLLAVGVLSVLFLDRHTTPEVSAHSTGVGSVESLTENYRVWLEEYEKNGGDRNMSLQIGAFGGISEDFTNAQGFAHLNLIDGKVAVEVNGLPKTESYDVWLVDNTSGPSNGILPEEGDAMIRVGSLTRQGEVAKLEASLGGDFFNDFEFDLLVVTRAAKARSKTV